jgi:hypothetical protein
MKTIRGMRMIYIGNFLFVTNQQVTEQSARRHGGFNLMVEAESEAQALELCRQRITQYRTASSFFEGQSAIFLTQLLEFNAVPKGRAVMLNYKSFAGDPILPYIECAAPLAENNTCQIHQWIDNQPTTEGCQDRLFMEFKA